jgi:hypothetical protein
METLQDLYQKRNELRIAMRKVWQSGRKGMDYVNAVREVDEPLKAVHQQILAKECTDPSLRQLRHTYSVYGYSERHEYFRKKHAQFDKLENAILCFNQLKNDPDWNIPTLVIKETYLRQESPALVDFNGPIDDLAFSEKQEIVEKHMMGCRKYRWNHLISGYSRWTY